MIISLNGFMGCGKSSVGRKLSELLSCAFIDLDSVIEEAAGRKIPEIFATDGEAAFRKMELQTLQKLLAANSRVSGMMADEKVNLILSLGGGTVMTPECAEAVNEQTLCVYLRASVDTLVSHLEGESEGRPMLNCGAASSDSEALRHRIEELMSIRSATYEKIAHIIIDTDGKEISHIAEEIFTESRPFRACP